MFELGQGDNLPFSPALTLASVQLPCGPRLQGHGIHRVQGCVRWGAGLPFWEKRNADFIQKG